jgi:NADH:ubiquinone oxidoreductase subunit E
MKIRRMVIYIQDHYGDKFHSEESFDPRENVIPREGEYVTPRGINTNHKVTKVAYDQFKNVVEVYLRFTIC